MVTVTSATSTKPSVFPLMPCGSGGQDTVTLGCLATGFSPSALTFTWKQGANVLEDFITYPSIQKGSEYMGISQIQVNKLDWDANKPFECIANHAAGQGNGAMVKPNVVYQLPTLTLTSSVDEENEEVSISCFAKDFSPKTYEFIWMKDDEVINQSSVDKISMSSERKNVNGTTLYSAANLLTMKKEDLTPEDKFMCVFKGKGKSTSAVKNDTVQVKECTGGVSGDVRPKVDIQITEPTIEDLFVYRKGKLTCQVTIDRGRFEKVVWEDENQVELVMTPKNGKSSNVHIVELEITYDEWSKKVERSCVVHHEDLEEPLKKLYKRTSGGPQRRPSVFMLPPLEHIRQKEVTLTCYVKDFFPHEVYVAWLVDDENAAPKYEFNTTKPVENFRSYYVYSQLTIPLEDWRQPDVAYSCVVYHESLNDSRTVVRSIGYRTSESTNLVNLNIPNMCKT